MLAALPIGLVVISAVAYHLAQKAAGHAVSPWPVLAIAYGAAFAVTLGIAVMSGDAALRLPARGERTAGVVIGLAALGVEVGYFFLYRSGWSLGTTSVIVNAVATVALCAVGLIVFGDQLSTTRVVGVGVALAGAALIARG